MRTDRGRPAAAAAGLFLLGGILVAPPVPAADYQNGQTVWVQSAAPLRVQPRQTSATVVPLAAGAQIRLTTSQESPFGRWWHARAEGREGWVLEKFLLPERPFTVEQAHRDAAKLPMPDFTAPAQGEDRSAELTRYWRAIRDGSVEQRTHDCQLLPFSGHTDEQFFTLLDSWLKARYEQALREQQAVEADVTRCLQALASSGNPQYQQTLSTWANSPQMGKAGKKFIRRYQVLLSDSTVWNPIINRTDTHSEGRSWATTRAINMLQSGLPQLQREGMRRLKRRPKDHPAAFDVLEAELLASYKSGGDPLTEDSIAWQCKTLAVSRNPKYAPTLTKVAAETDSTKIRRHCGDSVDVLGSPPDEGDDEAEEDA